MGLRIATTFPLALGTPGGGTKDCMSLARHLVRQGAEVCILAASSSGPAHFPRPRPQAAADGRAEIEELARAGVEVIRVAAHPAHFLLDGLPMRRAVARLLRERTFDVCLGWWHEAAFLARVAREHGVAFAMNAAASYTPILAPASRPERLRQLLRAELLIKPPLRRAAAVFVRSRFTKGELVRLAGVAAERIHVAPCGVDTDLSSVPRAPAKNVSNLLFFGRFVPEKGLFDALAALGRLAAEGSNGWRLRVAGWGASERVLHAARQHGIENRVELLGSLDRPGLRDALAWAQVALLPSYTESFGLANAEAQMAGVPVVAYAAGAVPEVVEHGRTGWLAPTGDVQGLGAALREALADPARTHAFGLAGRERMTTRFTWERAAAMTLAGLRDLQKATP